jgi:type II secretory pathway pseudopilin PulG
MKNQNQTNVSGVAGFSKVELLVVMGSLTLLIVLLVLGVTFGKENRRRAQCRANLRQVGVALQLYANDNGQLLPDCTERNPAFCGSVWPWDMHTNLVTELENRGAKRDFLYCPSNAGMNDDRHWNFPRYSGGQTRVVGYVFLFSGCRDVPPNLARLKLNGDGGRKPAETELTMDATVNQSGDYTHIKGLSMDRSSHVSGENPAGGNILFEDGHAGWRPFKEMRHRIVAQVVWDF